MTLEQDTTKDDLTAEEREILEFMLRNKRQGKLIEAKIRACDHTKDAVLSFGQQRSWMQHELNKGQSSPYDTLCLNLRVRGKLNVDAMHRSLAEIVRRHEILRTTFILQDADPVQVVGEVDPVFEYEDLSNLADTERESCLAELLRKAGNTLFDLVQDPLFQTRLIRLAEADHVLCLTMHHIVFDEWSKGILLRELSLLYPAFDGEQQSPLPELPIQYRDFSVWQRDWLQGEVLQKHLDYWTQKLAGLSTLELPTDYPRPQQQTFNGAYEKLTLSRELSDALDALSKQHGVTLFITMLSALGILLHRYCGQDDISIGTVITNRDRDELHDLIGFFLNTLVMRLDLSAEPSFPELVERVKDTAMGAFAHQHLPFDRLVEKMNPQRETNRNPLFQVSLTMLDAPATSSLRIKDLELTPISGMGFESLFDLDVFVNEGPAGLVLNFVYNTDLFAAVTVRRMLQHFKELLQAVVTDASRPVSKLPMLTRSEYDQIVVGWNQTHADYVNNETLHSLFEQQVKRTPLAQAVRFEQHSLNYSELEQKANDMACLLLAKNVEPGQLVGIFLERSIDLVVAILGVLKAGAAYVPLDTANPAERINYILQDSNIRILLSQQKLEQRLPVDLVEIVDVDDSSKLANVAPRPLPPVSEDMLAYVIYTSGSTGRPKGVMVAHSAVVNHAHWLRDYTDFDHNDRVLQKSPINFDASVCELFLPLIFGGCIVMASPGGDKDSAYLIQEIREHKVTVLILVPSALRMLLQGLSNPADLGTLRFVGCGGEELAPDLQREYYEKCSAQLYNMYGPTEATIDTACFICPADFDGDKIPIGTPIANARAYILGPLLQPVPIGVQGELHVGGSGLAQGYLNQPELTAEKFIADPFSDDPAARLYRTGDLARYLADGNIEFLGRIDRQVKLRGFRIELGEIESVLAQQESVRDAVAIVCEDETGDKRLIAYVVPKLEWNEQNVRVESGVFDESPAGEQLPNGLIPGLRQHLREQLPAYMVPSLFVVLDEFPLNANGKLDRRALPDPGDIRSSLEVQYTAPRNEIEERLAGIWADILQLESVGIHDNFFDLGGHSLMATQVVSRVRGQLNVELPLSEMFAYPTVAELARVLESLLHESGGSEADVIPVIDRQGDLPLSFAQERLWFLHQLEPESTAYNMPLALRLKGKLRVDALLASLNTIVSRHEALRTRFVTHQGEPTQVVDEVTIELLQEDLSTLSSEALAGEVKARIDAEALQPFDLSTGPLLRCSLLRLSDHEHVLLFTMHHIISDGWSMGVLFRELGTCYAEFSSGRQPKLPELPVHYADFASWQRQRLNGEVLTFQLDYWRQQLDGLTVLELPTDRPRPPLQTFDGAVVKQRLPTKLGRELERFSQQEGITLFMTLLAAFSGLMYRYSGQEDIVVGSPIANRNRSELEGLIGFFVNSLVMRIDVSGNPGFRELVQRVNRTALGAYDHQDLPFEKLVDEIQPQRDLSQNPLFQVMFALQNTPKELLVFEGLTLQATHQENPTTRFDLEVHIWEGAEFLSIFFLYNTNLFDEATISRMLSHYQALLEAMVAAPDMRIAEAPMLSEQERQQVVSEWNRTATDYPRDKTVHQIFELQATKFPDSIALEYEEETLSYQRLNERANQLAHYLQARGVGPEVMVGISVERSLEMVVGLLGIMKAGGAYVPLDPDYPLPRLSFMLEDAEIKTILTMSSQLPRMPLFSGDVICLDTDWTAIARESTHNTVSTAGPESLIYVIYTSGSTGRPKGTLIEHRSVVRLVKETNYVEFGAQDIFLQFAPLAFDASTFEIWGSLLNAARLVVFPAGRSSLEELGQFIKEKNVTTLWLTSALFSQMVDNHVSSLSGVKQLLAGGEALSLPHVQKMLDQLGDRRLINGYGPTENTTFTCCHVMAASSQLPQSVPIGRPISNTTVYILDAGMNPVPVGVPGQLYIGGDGLARGYLNQPEMTTEKFIPDPYSECPEARLYATGDQVRYRLDGSIEYIGRIDQQVKVRGYRIELGEIETALVENAAVDEAVVLVREDEPGDKRVAAYVVPSPVWVEQISSSQSGEHVDEWQALYEETYGNIDDSLDLTRNFTGWNSSYTGEPIALAEMEEWLESTVARIGALQPKRVLEIGCGTGLLLYRLAPVCERYVGTDFSAVAQQQVRGVVSNRDEYRHVELWLRQANDFSDVGAGDFDTVVINSVTQYLPSMDYLVSVIEASVAAIGDGGRILLGDIRSLPLLKAYHTSVQLYLSVDDAGGGELLRNIQQHVEEENELVIEPAFFHALQQRIPRLSHVEVLLKQGQHHNELTRYRYDVILHVEAPAEPLSAHGQWLDWGVSGLNVAQLQARLAEADQAWLGINGIPNARIAHDVAVLEQLQGGSSGLSVGELRQSAESALQQPVEPDDLWRLAEAAGYQLELSYTGAGTDGRMDALFRRSKREDCAGSVFWPRQQEVPERPWSAYGSNPLKGRLGNELIPLLRQDLQQHLPEYMLPSVYVVLDALPLNPNGKVERKALPVPGDVRASLGAEYTAPRSELERHLAEIWAQVLKLERVGIHDNFFDLGGHSLMATQVVSRIRGQLNVELPLSEMFGYPTVAELTPVVGSLLDESDERENGVIPAAERNANLPLSFAQERLWFLDQLEPGGTAYNVPLALRLKGELSVAVLEDSLNAIVDRQESLRTHFSLDQGKPFQIIEDVTIELELEDLSALTAEMLDDEVNARVDAEAIQPFDLSTGPLLRCSLLRLSDHEHVLLLTMHHVISDGWSLGVMFRELGACYEAFSRGEQPALAELPIQYADFAVWQREWLSGEVLASQMAYWREKLEDLSTLNLPTDRPRPAVQTFTGCGEKMTLDAELSKRLKTLSRQAGVTLFMTLLGGFAVLMHRYSGQEDIVVGSPIANRNRSELEDLIGFFVNSLVIRTDVSGNPGFRELVQRVNQTALDAYEHQDLPFEKLVDEIQPERDLSLNPLFQVMFALQNAPMESLDLKGLKLESVRRDITVASFDLECHVWERGDELQVNLVYNTILFNADSIRRMLEHYRNLLQSIAAEPDRHISELTMLSQHEQRQLIEWNQTTIDYPRDKTVHELFEQQVARAPHSIAVEFAGKTLSYAQLNQRANQLAHYLSARGVGPEVMVGMYVERCLEMVIGLLGILKAGGAYVPLDLDYPTSRIAFMLTDTQLPVLLTLSSLEEKLPVFEGEQICLDSDWAVIENESEANPDVAISADSLAYVIYTSGSTGTPKGVEIVHRAINRLVCNTDYFQVDDQDRIVQASNVSFDAATFELWGALLNGARLVGIDKDSLLNVKSLASFLQAQKITAMFITTALFNQIAREAPKTFEGLRGLMFGGEAVDADAVRRVVENGPPEYLLHVYGPTESTTFASWYRVEDVAAQATTVPIGRPISNTVVYILDGRMQPVPVGVPGELYIGGDGLARGYLNQPEITEEKFVADPFSDDPQARLYATGDQVRYRSDGNIEFIGRIDNQVKIRGFRIELGEVETILSQHDFIKACAALIYEDLQGNKNIAAYFVSDSSFSTLSLRNFLRKKVPQYMIPTVLTKLDEIPVTPNGKTDYKTLASYTKGKTIRDTIYLPPETRAEKTIASIWETLLNVDRIGVGDSFFDIGGHSLLLIQAKSAIEKELGVSVPVMDFFHQTLGQIATYCEKKSAT